MQEEFIRDFSGRAVGILKHYDNGDMAAIEFPSQKILGFYRKKSDVTTDFYGRVISRGNTVVQFLYKK